MQTADEPAGHVAEDRHIAGAVRCVCIELNMHASFTMNMSALQQLALFKLHILGDDAVGRCAIASTSKS